MGILCVVVVFFSFFFVICVFVGVFLTVTSHLFFTVLLATFVSRSLLCCFYRLFPAYTHIFFLDAAYILFVVVLHICPFFSVCMGRWWWCIMVLLFSSHSSTRIKFSLRFCRVLGIRVLYYSFGVLCISYRMCAYRTDTLSLWKPARICRVFVQLVLSYFLLYMFPFDAVSGCLCVCAIRMRIESNTGAE